MKKLLPIIAVGLLFCSSVNAGVRTFPVDEVYASAFGTNGTFVALTNAVTKIGSRKVVLIVDSKATWPIDAALTIPSNISLDVRRGTTLTGSSTLLVQGPILVDPKRVIFDGPTVTVSNNQPIAVGWWGADQSAFNAAITAAGSIDSVVLVAQPTSVTTKTVPANVTLRIEPNSVMTISGKISMYGDIDAGIYQIFDGSVVPFIGGGKHEVITVYPEWFGAVGYDLPSVVLTDDTLALQRSIDLAGQGGTVYLSTIYAATNLKTRATSYGNDSMTIRGASSGRLADPSGNELHNKGGFILFSDNAECVLEIGADGDRSDNITLENVCFLGNDNTTTNSMLFLNQAYDCEFRNCSFYACKGRGITMELAQDCLFQTCWFWKVGYEPDYPGAIFVTEDASDSYHNNDCEFMDCRFQFCAGGAFYYSTNGICTPMRISGCKFEQPNNAYSTIGTHTQTFFNASMPSNPWGVGGIIFTHNEFLLSGSATPTATDGVLKLKNGRGMLFNNNVYYVEELGTIRLVNFVEGSSFTGFICKDNYCRGAANGGMVHFETINNNNFPVLIEEPYSGQSKDCNYGRQFYSPLFGTMISSHYCPVTSLAASDQIYVPDPDPTTDPTYFPLMNSVPYVSGSNNVDPLAVLGSLDTNHIASAANSHMGGKQWWGINKELGGIVRLGLRMKHSTAAGPSGKVSLYDGPSPLVASIPITSNKWAMHWVDVDLGDLTGPLLILRNAYINPASQTNYFDGFTWDRIMSDYDSAITNYGYGITNITFYMNGSVVSNQVNP